MAVKAEAGLFGRRDFLSRAGLLALAGATLGGVAVGLRSLWPRRGQRIALPVPAGRPEEYAVGQVSGRLLQDHEVWVVRSAEGFVAFAAACTHLGCRLRHVSASGESASGEFRCMCHGSSFSAAGDVLRGPAARPLERVAISLGRDGELRVDPMVRYRKERGEWALPGAFAAYRSPGRGGAERRREPGRRG
jgi:cytochrome b6-f complex iron-sulfur subunit